MNLDEMKLREKRSAILQKRTISPYNALLVLAYLALFTISCKDLPEEKRRPIYSMQWDTVPQVKNLILPGDTLVLVSEWASRTPVNQLNSKSFYIPNPTIEYSGPDSLFSIDQKQEVELQFAKNFKSKFYIPSNCFPGIYKVTSWITDRDKQTSDTISFNFPLTVSAYPFCLIDTPQNARTVVLPIAQRPIYFKVRCFGSQISAFQYQWYDSLKSTTLGPLQLKETEMPSDQLVFADSIFPPSGSQKNLFLKLGSKTSLGRTTSYWLRFIRQ